MINDHLLIDHILKSHDHLHRNDNRPSPKRHHQQTTTNNNSAPFAYRNQATGTQTKHYLQQQDSNLNGGSQSLVASPAPGGATASLLRVPYAMNSTLDNGGQLLKPDRLSMYNGQVWFEPVPLVGQPIGGLSLGPTQHPAHPGFGPQHADRRASSAPSAQGSVQSDSRIMSQSTKSGGRRFFPNSRGYMANLNSLMTQNHEQEQLDDGRTTTNRKQATANSKSHHTSTKSSGYNKKSRSSSNRRRIVPIDASDLLDHHQINATTSGQQKKKDHLHKNGLASLDDDGEEQLVRYRPTTRPVDHNLRSGSLSSGDGGQAGSSASGETLILDSDQELLGFDSTGTPIIATLRGRADQLLTRGNSLTIAEPQNNKPAAPSQTQSQLDHQPSNGASKPLEPNERNQLPRPVKVAPGGGTNKQSSQDPVTGSAHPVAEEVASQASATKQEHEQQRRSPSQDNGAQSRDSGPERALSTKESHPPVSKLSSSKVDHQTKLKEADEQEDQDSSQIKQPITNTSADIMTELNERLKAKRSGTTGETDRANGGQTKEEPKVRDHEDQTKRIMQSEKTPEADTRAQVESQGTGVAASKVPGGPESRPPKLQANRVANQKAVSISSSELSSDNEQTGSGTKSSAQLTAPKLEDEMKNGDLLKKESIFALTYKQLASEKLPAD